MTKPKLRFKDKNGNAYPEWKEFKIKDIGNISMCKRVFKEQTSSKGEIPFYKIGTFGKTPDAYISRKLFQELKTKYSYPQIGAILISASGTIGRTVEYKGEDAYFQDSNIIWINHDNKIKDKFLKLLLQNTDWDKVVEGSTIKRLYNNNLLKIKVPLPCIDEQEKIAGFLSKVDELINECEGEVKDLEEQKKGLMQKIFSQQIRFKDSNNNPYPDWKEKKIKDISVVITGNTPKTSEQDNYGDKYLWCSPIDLGNEKYIKKKKKMLSEKGISKSRKIPKGSILVTCIGSTIGKIGFATEIMATNQQINSMLIKKENNEYIYYSLLYNFPKYMSFVSKQAVPIINKTQFENLKIDIPCLEEQEKIAKVLSKMDELIEEKKALLSDWQQFKKGLLQQMFV